MTHDWAHHYDFKPVLTSKTGSKLRRDWSRVPWNGMACVLEAFEEGRKYDAPDGQMGFLRDDYRDSVLHLAEHAIAALNTSGTEQRMHLSHAAARALMALELIERGNTNESGM